MFKYIITLFKTMNLNEEYILKQKIYSQQKEYRQTPEGKLALRRAREKQLLKQMLEISQVLECRKCGNDDFTMLIPFDNSILCYNCKYQRPDILEIDIKNGS